MKNGRENGATDAKLDRLEAEFAKARDAGDRAEMDRIAREYHEILPLDAGAAQMLEDCIARILVTGSLRVH